MQNSWQRWWPKAAYRDRSPGFVRVHTDFSFSTRPIKNIWLFFVKAILSFYPSVYCATCPSMILLYILCTKLTKGLLVSILPARRLAKQWNQTRQESCVSSKLPVLEKKNIPGCWWVKIVKVGSNKNIWSPSESYAKNITKLGIVEIQTQNYRMGSLNAFSVLSSPSSARLGCYNSSFFIYQLASCSTEYFLNSCN